MLEKSLIDLAYDVISESDKPVAFEELWKTVTKKADLDEASASNGVADFYTGLTFDGRFVKEKGSNSWDLKSRYAYKDYHIDTSAYYAQEDTKSDDNEDSNEEKDYNAAFEEPKPIDETEGFGNEEAGEEAPKDEGEESENA